MEIYRRIVRQKTTMLNLDPQHDTTAIHALMPPFLTCDDSVDELHSLE